ncbi:MAG: aminopeptidase [Deltaproteobacteria bacterium]|nr:aminopeptidase [Deltaproteobacteria bacterium]
MTFSDETIKKYCHVLLWALKAARKGPCRKNEIVMIRYELPALRLAEALQSSLLDAGMNPVLRVGMTPRMEKQFYVKSNKRQLVFQPPGERELYQKLNGGIYLHAPDSLTHLADVDSNKIGKAAVARKSLKDILDRREETGKFSWTLCLFPTAELAKQARLPMAQYAAQVIKACYLDRKNPVEEWKKTYRSALEIKRWLNRMRIERLHVESDRMDLRLTPGERRRWVGITGHNVPSFEIFLSPDWRGTEGIYYADQPSFRNGNYVESVKLTFKKGKVVKSEAAKGGSFLAKQAALDPGAARVGEFSLTDKRFSRIDRFMANTLFDENYGGKHGNCHLALGSSYSDTFAGDSSTLTKEKKKKLGFNDSALHWDLVNTEDKRVTAYLAGGKKVVIYEEGIFAI